MREAQHGETWYPYEPQEKAIIEDGVRFGLTEKRIIATLKDAGFSRVEIKGEINKIKKFLLTQGIAFPRVNTSLLSAEQEAFMVEQIKHSVPNRQIIDALKKLGCAATPQMIGAKISRTREKIMATRQHWRPDRAISTLHMQSKAPASGMTFEKSDLNIAKEISAMYGGNWK